MTPLLWLAVGFINGVVFAFGIFGFVLVARDRQRGER